MEKAALWAEMLTRIGSANTRLAQSLVFLPPQTAAIQEQVEQERSRIALELHSGAGQPLSAIKLHLELLLRETSLTGSEERIACLQALADSALDQVRAVSHRLHPPHWKSLSLPEALHHLIAETGLDRDFRTELDIRNVGRLSFAVHSAMYRCAQECLSNVIRHSKARGVSIELSREADIVQLTVSDDGVGMHGEPRDGMGIRAIHHYAGEMNGLVRVFNAAQGVTVRVSVPAEED